MWKLATQEKSHPLGNLMKCLLFMLFNLFNLYRNYDIPKVAK